VAATGLAVFACGCGGRSALDDSEYRLSSETGGASSSVGPTAPATTKVAAGFNHNCVLKADGTVNCWGHDDPVVTGNAVSSNVPVPVNGISSAVDIAAGTSSSCALIQGGTVQCWGYNGLGQLGTGDTKLVTGPVQVIGVSNAVDVGVAGSFGCALEGADRVLQCWGSRTFNPMSVQFPNAATIDCWGSKGAGTFVLMNDGTVMGWGFNGSGQLGDGSTVTSNWPVGVNGITQAQSVSGGFMGHTCAGLANGSVKCWGANGFGQLGDGTTSNRATPVDVVGISTAIAVSAGGSHTCAVLQGGSMVCWGYNGTGQLGIGSTQGTTLPVTVPGITSASMPASGSAHTCVLGTDGTVSCWGANPMGQLGNGTTTDSWVPVRVSGY